MATQIFQKIEVIIWTEDLASPGKHENSTLGIGKKHGALSLWPKHFMRVTFCQTLCLYIYVTWRIHSRGSPQMQTCSQVTFPWKTFKCLSSLAQKLKLFPRQVLQYTLFKIFWSLNIICKGWACPPWFQLQEAWPSPLFSWVDVANGYCLDHFDHLISVSQRCGRECHLVYLACRKGNHQ